MAIPELKDAKERLTDCIYFGDPISASVGTGFVPTTRQINTTAPLAGGGDLSTNRTLTISEFAGSTPGSVPTSLGGVVNFLRADGSWATPPTFGAAAAGYAPASGGGSTNYLRADGTWAAPPGAGISGLSVDNYPVGTSATTIGPGRIFQSADSMSFRTAYSDASNYNAVDATHDTGTDVFSLYPVKIVAAATQDCSLKMLAGGSGTAAITLGGTSITGVGNLALTGNAAVTGKMSLTESAISLSNGLNSNVSLTGKTTHLRVTGPTGAFSLGGFTGGTDGQYIVFHNTTAQPMTIVNEDLSSTAANRIYTGTSANVVFPAYPSVVTFWYSSTDARWLIGSASLDQSPTLTTGYVPYMGASSALANSGIFWDSANSRMGVGTATPAASLDVAGTTAIRYAAVILSPGLNSNIPAPTRGSVSYTASNNFSVGGIVPPGAADGARLLIYNVSSYQMTIVQIGRAHV